MRLMDKDALLELWDSMTPRARTEFDQDIMLFPQVEAEPICHGHWIEEMGMFMCSVCYDAWGTENEEMIKAFNYCPNCGAKMDGEEE